MRDPEGGDSHGGNPFAGAWRLVSWENSGADGSVARPFGDNPVGCLLYSEDGHMAVEIMDPDRHPSDPRLPVEAAFSQALSDEDRLAAYGTYLSYCGTYSFFMEEGIVVHHVKAGLIPSWAGSDQVRRFRFEEGRLILGAERARLAESRVRLRGCAHLG